jgi:hypothetical protein
MSLQRLSPLLALTDAATESVLQPAVESTAAQLFAPVRGLAFWSAILLPLTYLPMLFSDLSPSLGIAGTDAQVVGALICLNLVALLLGHSHNRPVEN